MPVLTSRTDLCSGGAVLVLHDGAEGAVRLPEDAAVVAPVLQHGGEEVRRCRPEGGSPSGAEGLSPLHQGVPAADQHMAVKALQQRAHCTACPVPCCSAWTA